MVIDAIIGPLHAGCGMNGSSSKINNIWWFNQFFLKRFYLLLPFRENDVSFFLLNRALMTKYGTTGRKETEDVGGACHSGAFL